MATVKSPSAAEDLPTLFGSPDSISRDKHQKRSPDKNGNIEVGLGLSKILFTSALFSFSIVSPWCITLSRIFLIHVRLGNRRI